MPILLLNPRTLPESHGQPGMVLDMVEVVGMNVETIDDQMLLTMQYGTRDGEGNWIPGPEPLHVIRIRDVPARTQGGIDPADGLYKMMEVEPADPRFTAMVNESLTQFPTGTKIFLETQLALYAWLLSHGPEDGSAAAYYEGTPIP